MPVLTCPGGCDGRRGGPEARRGRDRDGLMGGPRADAHVRRLGRGRDHRARRGRRGRRLHDRRGRRGPGMTPGSAASSAERGCWGAAPVVSGGGTTAGRETGSGRPSSLTFGGAAAPDRGRRRRLGRAGGERLQRSRGRASPVRFLRRGDRRLSPLGFGRPAGQRLEHLHDRGSCLGRVLRGAGSRGLRRGDRRRGDRLRGGGRGLGAAVRSRLGGRGAGSLVGRALRDLAPAGGRGRDGHGADERRGRRGRGLCRRRWRGGRAAADGRGGRGLGHAGGHQGPSPIVTELGRRSRGHRAGARRFDVAAGRGRAGAGGRGARGHVVPRLVSACLALGTSGAPLHHAAVGAHALLDDLWSLLPLQMTLHPLDDVGLDGAHVIAHVADAHGLEERDQRLLIHVQLLGDLVDPNLTHAPRSKFDRPHSALLRQPRPHFTGAPRAPVASADPLARGAGPGAARGRVGTIETAHCERSGLRLLKHGRPSGQLGGAPGRGAGK